MIQKSSRRFSRSLRVSLLTFDIFVNCSIRLNFVEMFHEIMAMYFKMIARWNCFRVIDIFPVII